MNFARTNLSVLLARQSARAATGRTSSRPAERAQLLPQALPSRVAPVTTPTAAAAGSRTLDQAIEWFGAITMMAAVLVLALFG